MSLAQLALIHSRFPFPARKIFRRRAIVKTSDACCADARIIDLSYQDINLMIDQPLPVGESVHLAFNITVDQKTRQIELRGRIGYCVLTGIDGYRVRLDVAVRDGIDYRKRLSNVIESLL